MYWKINLTVPIYPKVSYVFTDTGDWFFVNFGTENTTDTRFRDIEQHQIKFNIFPSLSIGPELDLLFYENKSSGALQGTFLRQDQIMMKAQFGFDLFNLRKETEPDPVRAVDQIAIAAIVVSCASCDRRSGCPGSVLSGMRPVWIRLVPPTPPTTRINIKTKELGGAILALV